MRGQDPPPDGGDGDPGPSNVEEGTRVGVLGEQGRSRLLQAVEGFGVVLEAVQRARAAADALDARYQTTGPAAIKDMLHVLERRQRAVMDELD